MSRYSKDPQEEILLQGIHEGIDTEEDLWKFNLALTGHGIPYRPICTNINDDINLPHTTPWRLFADTYFQRYQAAVVIGPRGGGKTDLVSKILAVLMFTKPAVEVSCVAAIERQAAKCSKYMNRWLSNEYIDEYVVKHNKRERELVNGSNYEQLIGTMSGSNSPHPNFLAIDEVDLMLSAVLEELKMVPVSSDVLRAMTLYISSRKFPLGIMDRMYRNADQRGMKKYIWCWKEISEPCSDARSGTRKKIYEGIDPDTKQPIMFEAYDGCEKCPLLFECRGDVKKSTGWFPLEDTINRYKNLVRDTWRNQVCCLPPRVGTGILDIFSMDDNVDEVHYDENRPIDLVWDWGAGGADTVCIFIQENPEDQRDIVKIPHVYRASKALPVRIHGETVRDLCLSGGFIPRQILSDSAAVQEILDLQDFDPNFYGFVKPAKKIQIEESIPLLKRLIRKFDGSPGLVIDSSCTRSINEMLGWSRDDKTGRPSDKNIDFIDALRYWTIERSLHTSVGVMVLDEEGDDNNWMPDRFVVRNGDYDF